MTKPPLGPGPKYRVMIYFTPGAPEDIPSVCALLTDDQEEAATKARSFAVSAYAYQVNPELYVFFPAHRISHVELDCLR